MLVSQNSKLELVQKTLLLTETDLAILPEAGFKVYFRQHSYLRRHENRFLCRLQP